MKQNRSRLVRAVRRAGVLIAMGSGVAAAADAPNEPLAEVVVTGIRASIANQVTMKEQSDDIIEAISAEDLGKLPDLSIADSLARLPGLAAQRTDGHSNFISIRGFAPDFSGTTLSGREQASTGENRGVEFDQYPAELINRVEVYKTPDASLIGQGIAGTVNLNTIKPLSFNELRMALNVRGELNSNSNLNPDQGISSWGSRVSFSVLDQFLGHTLGLAFGAARLDSPTQEKQYQAWYWGQNNGPPGSGAIDTRGSNPVPPVPGDPNLALSDEGMQVRAKSQSNVRTGLMGVLEWAPSDGYHSELDLFYSRFDQHTYLNGLQWSSSPYGDGISYSNAQTTPFGAYSVLTAGTLNGVKPIMQNEFTQTNTHNFSAGWNNRVETAGDWTLVSDLAYSNAHNAVHDAYAFTGPESVVVNGIGFQIPLDGHYPAFNIPVNLADPGLVGFTDPDNYSYNGREEWDQQSDTIKAVRLDVIHPLGWIFKTFDVGFDYSDRRKVKSALVDFAYLDGNGCSTAHVPTCAPYNHALYAPINPAVLMAPTSLGYAGIFPGALDYNVLNALRSQFYLVQDMGTNDYNRNYSVEERVPLGYLKLNIDTALAGIHIRGNAGVQFVHTNQSSSALVTNPQGGQPDGTVTGGTSYNEVLPSLNLVGDLGNRNILRLGAAKTMMRGRIDDEKAASSASVGATSQAWSGSGGNPQLKPYIAIGEDLSYEKVFGNASYFSLALFNKNLTSYIYRKTVLYDFAGFTSAATQPLSTIGTFTTPENSSGGRIQGYELALALEGNLFASALDGFGLLSNFAYTNNFIPNGLLGQVPGGPTTFPGFSKKVGAATLYYDKYGVQVRVAWTYRSSFTGEVLANFDQLGYTEIATERTVNFQAGYEFRTGKIQGLSILLQINNLTDSPYRTVAITTLANGAPSRTPHEYDTFGRTYLVGFNYKL